jgi:Beta/Gamma crystallin
MNRIRLVFPRSKALLIALLLSGMSINIYAEEKDCWGNFFEGVDYSGKRLYVQGPAQLEKLTKVESDNWDKRIHSLKVGPKAKVTVYQNPRFELTLTEMAKKPDFMNSWGITEQDIKEDTELIFNADDAIHDLGDFNFHKKIRSLKIECL